jgi:phosphoserine aminotransferase
LKKQGGVRKMQEINIAKASLLYEYLDQTEFYHSPVAKEDRSRMNVPFMLRNDKLDAEFLKQAHAGGLAELKGHRAVGGMRASIYNAMPVEGVKALVAFMKEFERKNG